MLGVIVEAMLGYASGAYDVIVDGIVGPRSLPPFASGARSAEVVLRPTFEEMFAREVAREGKGLRASAPLKGLYAAFATLGVLERHAIDTTGDTTAATARRVREGVAAGTFELAE